MAKPTTKEFGCDRLASALAGITNEELADACLDARESAVKGEDREGLVLLLMMVSRRLRGKVTDDSRVRTAGSWLTEYTKSELANAVLTGLGLRELTRESSGILIAPFVAEAERRGWPEGWHEDVSVLEDVPETAECRSRSRALDTAPPTE